jgi:hypothetical protein
LAARFSRVTAGGLFLNPSDNQGVTYKYVSRCWEMLSKGQWPQPNNKSGELFRLQWTLHEGNVPVAELRMLDVSGEDLREIFDDGRIDETVKLSEGHRCIADYLREAKIVLVLVDLDDIVSFREGEHVRQTQWVINYALKCAKANDRQVTTALVFTKMDRYTALVQREGGWEGAARQYLPLVYGNHVADGQLAILPVAAVADTRLDTSSGTPRPVPAPNFSSMGLDPLMTWIVEKARELCESERVRRKQEALRYQTGLHAAQGRKHQLTCKHINRLRVKSMLFALVIGIALQAITIPVLCRVCKDQRDVPTTTVVRDPYLGNWYLWWQDKDLTRTKTITGITTIRFTNYKKVAIWDILLSSAVITIIAIARFKTLLCANPAPQDDQV